MYYVLWFERNPRKQGNDNKRNHCRYLAVARTSAYNISLRDGVSDVAVVDKAGNVRFSYDQQGNETKGSS